VEQLEHRFCPSYSLVTSRAALAGTDSVDWATLGAPGTSVANPFTVSSAAGQNITTSKTDSANFLLDEQWGPTTGNSYVLHGNFAPGDIVLDTNGAPHTGKQNTITLNFGATPVAAGGAQIMTNLLGSFTAEVDALDAKGKTLARFKEDGNATDAADNSAIFLGISNTSSTIYQIAISVTKADNDQYKGVFAINKFEFRTSALAAAPATAPRSPALELASLGSSLLSAGQQPIPTEPLPGPAARSAAPGNRSGVQPASDTTAALHPEATAIVFAGSGAAATDDNAWLMASLSPSNLDTLS
jgi:hypothetical protein